MNLNIKVKLVFCSLILLLVSSCSPGGDDPISYTEGLAEITVDTESPVIVTEDTGLLLESEGILEGDQLIMRSVENNNNEIIVNWGYKYQGKNENGEKVWAKDSVIAQLKFDDRWTTGKWDVIVQRENKRQLLTTVECLILKLLEDEENPEAYVDRSELYKGFISVFADGWLGKGVDYYEFVNKETNEITAFDSDLDGQALPEPYAKVIVSFPRDTLASGGYDLYIKRWDYKFRQKICDFDYFRIALVNKDPIRKDEKGEFAFEFYLDEIWKGDQVSVGYGSKGFRETLTVANYNPETHIYRVVVPKAHTSQNVTFSISLRRNNQTLSLGEKQIIVTE